MKIFILNGKNLQMNTKNILNNYFIILAKLNKNINIILFIKYIYTVIL